MTEKEIDKLCDAVVTALEKGPLDPDGLREAAGKAVRNLGPEGKKKGLTTTLPVALEKLQASGDIRRVPTNGRFDQQRYQYALWRPNPLRNFKLSPEEVHTELARKYFAWIGPASVRRLPNLLRPRREGSQGRARSAEAGADRGRARRPALLPARRSVAKFDAFKPPKEPCYCTS